MNEALDIKTALMLINLHSEIYKDDLLGAKKLLEDRLAAIEEEESESVEVKEEAIEEVVENLK